MKLASVILATALLVRAATAQQEYESPPPKLIEKASAIAGTAAKACGVATSPSQNDAGVRCMQAANTSGKPFSFIQRSPGSVAWTGWARGPDQKVYVMWLPGEPSDPETPYTVECTAFEVGIGAHGIPEAACSMKRSP